MASFGLLTRKTQHPDVAFTHEIRDLSCLEILDECRHHAAHVPKVCSGVLCLTCVFVWQRMSARCSWDRARADASMLGHRPQRAGFPVLPKTRTQKKPRMLCRCKSQLLLKRLCERVVGGKKNMSSGLRANMVREAVWWRSTANFPCDSSFSPIHVPSFCVACLAHVLLRV